MGGLLRGGQFEAGGVTPFGGSVWEDRNAMGKSTKIHLVCLHGALCLGVIGTDERRVCRMTAVSCKISGRRKTKLVL
jgi:hypothetical protein